MVRRLALSALLVLASAPAHAQGSLSAAQGNISAILAELETNLMQKEAIEMNAKDLEPRRDGLQHRQDDINTQVQQATSYCQGTFPEPEYSNRKAYCESTFAQLETLQRQLSLEEDDYNKRMAELQERETARAKQGTAISERLGAAVSALISTCIPLPLDQQLAQCHLPSAPGPRTQALVADVEANLSSAIAQQPKN